MLAGVKEFGCLNPGFTGVAGGQIVSMLTDSPCLGLCSIQRERRDREKGRALDITTVSGLYGLFVDVI